MSGSLRYQDPDLRALLAGEYVLGNLQGQARLRFETLMREDTALRHQVTLWAQRLEPLNDELEARTPPASVWTAIEQQIGSDRQPSLEQPGILAPTWYSSRCSFTDARAACGN